MITRLAAQDLVERRPSETDKRLSKVFMTEFGRERIKLVDKAWKRLEKEAVDGMDTKDRKRLRNLLRQIEKNLSAMSIVLEADDVENEPEPEVETQA